MAGYLGTRIGQQILGRAEGATAFDNLPFASRPYLLGQPMVPGAVHRVLPLEGPVGALSNAREA